MKGTTMLDLLGKYGIERKLKSVHGWLGALILPWIVIAGITGFYKNHESLVLSVFPEPASVPFDVIENSGLSVPVTDPVDAMMRASQFSPELPLSFDPDDSHNGRTVWTFDYGPGDVIVDQATGVVLVRARYRETYFAADGTRLASGLRWSRVLSSLHERGWVGSTLGSWLADIAAIALVVFGLSGLVLFWVPRLRRRRNRRARRAVQAA